MGVENMNVKYTEADTHRNHEWQYSNSARPSAVTFLFRMFDEGKILKKGYTAFPVGYDGFLRYRGGAVEGPAAEGIRGGAQDRNGRSVAGRRRFRHQ